MPWSDAYRVKLVPLGGGEGIAFYRDMIDKVGGQYLIDSRFVDALDGNECVSKDLLHTPAVGIEFGIAAAGDAGGSYVVDVEVISDCLHVLSMEHNHSGEEVILGAPQTINEA